ncbi:MAG: hypothetical protein P8X70_03155 [Nanoarchaeota archaeon]|jgi:ribosomal RNA assembly protein
MKTIFSEKIPRIIKNKKRLEKLLNVKISIKTKDVILEGTAENEYIAEKVIDALNFGFPFSVATLIKKEDYLFEIINIKNHTKRKDLSRIKARIIGRKGKTLEILNRLTECYFEIGENQIGIIGLPEDIQKAQQSIISLIRGAKQGNVYRRVKNIRKKI